MTHPQPPRRFALMLVASLLIASAATVVPFVLVAGLVNLLIPSFPDRAGMPLLLSICLADFDGDD
jgi:hypothetical protein